MMYIQNENGVRAEVQAVTIYGSVFHAGLEVELHNPADVADFGVGQYADVHGISTEVAGVVERRDGPFLYLCCNTEDPEIGRMMTAAFLRMGRPITRP